MKKRSILCLLALLLCALLPMTAMAAPQVLGYRVLNADMQLSMPGNCSIEVVTTDDVMDVSWMGDDLTKYGSSTGMALGNGQITWQYTIPITGAQKLNITLYLQTADGAWSATAHTLSLDFQLQGQSQPAASSAAPTAPSWDTTPWSEYYAEPCPSGERYASWTGPGGSYIESGSFRPYKTTRIVSLFREKLNGINWIYVDLEYQNGYIRRCYVRSSEMSVASNLPTLELTGVPAVMNCGETPTYGPGGSYDSMDDALRQGASVSVLHEEYGYVFIEYNCASGQARGWVPADSVTEK